MLTPILGTQQFLLQEHMVVMYGQISLYLNILMAQLLAITSKNRGSFDKIYSFEIIILDDNLNARPILQFLVHAINHSTEKVQKWLVAKF